MKRPEKLADAGRHPQERVAFLQIPLLALGLTLIIELFNHKAFTEGLAYFWDFATEVAASGYEYNKEDPENSKKFDAYIERRNRSEKMFQEAMKVAQSGDTRTYTPQTDEMLRAQDIWQVIRHQLYLDRGGSVQDMFVDANTPISRTGEELPKIKKVE